MRRLWFMMLLAPHCLQRWSIDFHALPFCQLFCISIDDQFPANILVSKMLSALADADFQIIYISLVNIHYCLLCDQWRFFEILRLLAHQGAPQWVRGHSALITCQYGWFEPKSNLGQKCHKSPTVPRCFRRIGGPGVRFWRLAAGAKNSLLNTKNVISKGEISVKVHFFAPAASWKLHFFALTSLNFGGFLPPDLSPLVFRPKWSEGEDRCVYFPWSKSYPPKHWWVLHEIQLKGDNVIQNGVIMAYNPAMKKKGRARDGIIEIKAMILD